MTDDFLRNDGALLSAFSSLIQNNNTGLGDPSRDKWLGNQINATAMLPLTRMELLSLYRNSTICQKVVDLLPKSALQENWVEILIDKGRKGIPAKVVQYAEDLRIRHSLMEAAIMGRLDGDGFVVLGIDDGQAPDQPVNEEKIRSIRWAVPLNKYQLFPANKGRPGHPTYYQLYLTQQEALNAVSGKDLPEGSGMVSGNIHSSRVLRIPGKKLYSNLILWNAGYNDSALQAFYQSFSRYAAALEYSSRMVQDYNLFIYKLNGLAKLILQGETDKILQRFRAISMSMSSLGGLAMDAENEEGSFISRNYSGLDQLLDRLKDDTSAAAGMPPTRLWGSSQKSALSNSSEGDKYEWADCVDDYRAEVLNDPVKQLFKYIMLAQDSPTKGKLPDSWTLKWKSALRLNDQELINLRKDQTQGVDVPSVQAGILLPEEIRDSAWGGATYSIERQLQPDLFAKKQQQAQQQGGDQAGAAPTDGTDQGDGSTSDDQFIANSQAEAGRTDADDAQPTSDDHSQLDPQQLLQLRQITEEAVGEGSVDAIRSVGLDGSGNLTWTYRSGTQLFKAVMSDSGQISTDFLNTVQAPQASAQPAQANNQQAAPGDTPNA